MYESDFHMMIYRSRNIFGSIVNIQRPNDVMDQRLSHGIKVQSTKSPCDFNVQNQHNYLEITVIKYYMSKIFYLVQASWKMRTTLLLSRRTSSHSKHAIRLKFLRESRFHQNLSMLVNLWCEFFQPTPCPVLSSRPDNKNWKNKN